MHADQALAVDRWFDEYTGRFRNKDGTWPVLLHVKVDHSRRVAADMKLMAPQVGFDRDSVLAAYALGLLHDVGRFYQFAHHGTFRDEQSTDHGAAGRQALAEARVLAFCPEIDRRRIFAGVQHHNAKAVPAGLDAESLAFVRLIRDADKLDIFHVLYWGWKSGEIHRHPEYIFGVNPDGPVSSDALAELQARTTVTNRHIRSLADFFVTQLSWMYEINYSPTYRLIRDRGILDRIAEVLPREHAGVQAELAAARMHVERRAGETTDGSSTRP